MAKRSKRDIEEQLFQLKKLEEGLPSEEAAQEICRALSGANSILAARAARTAARLGFRQLVPDLVAVFERSMENPVKTDPGCRAKIAVVNALTELDWAEPDVFLRGIRHVQMEPSFGPPVDTAEELRAACAFGLYRSGYPELMPEMVSLLVDPQPAARRAVVKVLTEIGSESCMLLLRLKALHGDKEPEVVGDCLNGLMTIAPTRSLEFVERFLSADDPAVVEEAALAIGNAHLQEGFLRLRRFRESTIRPGFKRMLLLPIALTRCEEAFAFLLQVVREEHSESAAAAVQALSTIYGRNPEKRERIREAAFSRSDPEIIAAYQKEEFHHI